MPAEEDAAGSGRIHPMTWREKLNFRPRTPVRPRWRSRTCGGTGGPCWCCRPWLPWECWPPWEACAHSSTPSSKVHKLRERFALLPVNLSEALITFAVSASFYHSELREERVRGHDGTEERIIGKHRWPRFSPDRCSNI